MSANTQCHRLRVILLCEYYIITSYKSDVTSQSSSHVTRSSKTLIFFITRQRFAVAQLARSLSFARIPSPSLFLIIVTHLSLLISFTFSCIIVSLEHATSEINFIGHEGIQGRIGNRVVEESASAKCQTAAGMDGSSRRAAAQPNSWFRVRDATSRSLFRDFNDLRQVHSTSHKPSYRRNDEKSREILTHIRTAVVAVLFMLSNVRHIALRVTSHPRLRATVTFRCFLDEFENLLVG